MIYYGKNRIELFSYEATDKARNDTEKILGSLGFEPLFLSSFQSVPKMKAQNELKNIKKDDIIFIQFPTYCGEEYEMELLKIIKEKGARSAGIIHDLESIRFYNNDSDIKVLNMFDCISLPSPDIHKKLIKQGLKTKVEIQFIWDYLAGDNQKWFDKNADIVFAGNLSTAKSSWLLDVKFPLTVYGDNFNNMNFPKNIKYLGKKEDNFLPGIIGGHVGLLWEENDYKKYLKYNLSFKASLYLASNCPLIVPAKTHIGNIVERYNLGVTVKNIEYDEILKAIIELKNNQKLYQEKISEFGKEIREGKNMKNLARRMVLQIEI